jgi:chemotaxis protein MotB
MARRRNHEEHENHEAWAIPYGDLVTLLLAFFVVMYAMSSVNTGKYRVLSDALSSAFKGKPMEAHADNNGAPPPSITDSLPATVVNQMVVAGLPEGHPMPIPPARSSVREGVSKAGSVDARRAPANIPAVPEPLPSPELARVQSEVDAALAPLIRSNAVRVTRKGSLLEVQMSTDILFASGAAELSPAASKVLEELAAALKPWPNMIRVEGHTDDRPISSALFHSNWELSAARAASVVRLFIAHGVGPARLAVIGYGQFRPVDTNQTSAGRNANRRIEIMIIGSSASSPDT